MIKKKEGMKPGDNSLYKYLSWINRASVHENALYNWTFRCIIFQMCSVAQIFNYTHNQRKKNLLQKNGFEHIQN